MQAHNTTPAQNTTTTTTTKQVFHTIRDNMLCMAFEIERVLGHNGLPGKVTWIIDFSGFGLKHTDPRLGANALPMQV